jgi:hypothetical protein
MTKKDHQAQAEHHIAMGKLCKAALEAAEDGTPAHIFIKGALAEHTAAATRHIECSKAEADGDLEKRESLQAIVEQLVIPRIEKAVGEALANTVALPPMSRIAPTAPAGTLVPRFGGPDPAALTKKVDPQFSRLVLVDEDGQAS